MLNWRRTYAWPYAKKKLGFVDGLIPILVNDPEKEGNSGRLTLVISSILNTVKPSLWSSLNYFERADELWADLEEYFLVGNRPRKYYLKVTLANCKQGGDSVKTYYSRLKKIWDVIAAPPTITATATKVLESLKIFQDFQHSNGPSWWTYSIIPILPISINYLVWEIYRF